MCEFRASTTTPAPLRPRLWLLLLFAAAMPLPAGAAPASLFDDTALIVKAVDAIKEKIGSRSVRVLKVEITPDSVTIQAQDPKDRRHVDEWRSGRVKWGWLQWQMLRGPSPVQLNLINKDLEANLFDLDEIRFEAAGALIRQAIDRAALEDAGKIGGMEIERQVYILPQPSSGPVRWRVNITSGRVGADRRRCTRHDRRPRSQRDKPGAEFQPAARAGIGRRSGARFPGRVGEGADPAKGRRQPQQRLLRHQSAR